jgi:hypothetical protein
MSVGGNGAAAGAGVSGGTGGAGSGGSGTTGGAGGSGGSTSNGSLIPNGDFENGDTGWSYDDTNGFGIGRVLFGRYCVDKEQGTIIVGWPANPADAFGVSEGTSYVFSFDASFTGNYVPTVTAKVGQAVGPYAALFETTISIGLDVQHYSYPFTASFSDAAVGVAFSIASAYTTQVCIDNVTLVPQ